ncbi:MAG: Tol-Pal system protein TolB, partial [Gammaproteobacteria bacterium]
MKSTRNTLCVVIVLLVILFSSKAFAVLEIEITRGVEAAAPIAIVGFPWMGTGQPPSAMVGAVVRNDLNRSGRFRPLSQADIIEKPTRGSDINWATWRLLKSNYLVIGRINPGTGGGYVVEFELFDVLTQERLLGKAIEARPGELRRVAHHVSDLIFERILGIRGAFSTKIAYITVTGDGDERRYALVVADADGFGPQEVVRSKEPLLSPNWSPDGRYLAYVSFEKGNSSIYVQEIATGSRQQLSGLAG